MSSTLGVAKEVASMITGILLLFSACGGYFRFMAHRRLERAVDEAAIAAKAAQLQEEQAPASDGFAAPGENPPGGDSEDPGKEASRNG